MPVDTSMYGQQPAVQYNPLQAGQQGAGIANAVQENRLLKLATTKQQQDLDARQSIGEALQKNIRSDGTVDEPNLFKDLSGDPRARPIMQEAIQNALTRNSATDYTGTDQNGNPIPKAIPSQYFRTLPGQPGTQGQQPAPNQDNSAQSQKPQLSDQDIQDAHTKVGALQGAAQSIANHPNPTRGDAFSAFGDLIGDGHLTPQEAVGVATDPKSPMPQDPQAIKAWAAQHAAQLGQAQQSISRHPAVQATLNPQPLVSDAPAGNPNLSPDEKANAVQGLFGAQSSPGVNMGVPVNAPQAQELYSTTISDAKNARQQAVIDQKIIDLSRAGAPTGTVLKDVYGVLKQAGLTSRNSEDPAVQLDEIHKYMAQRVGSQGNGSTNDWLHQTESASPNDTQLPEAIQSLSKFNKASTMMHVAKADALQNSGVSPNDYNANLKFEQNWRNVADQRVIQYSLMNPEEKAAYVKTLAPQDAAAMVQKLRGMKQLNALSNLQ